MFEFSFLFVIVCCSAQEVIKPLMSNSADVYFVGNAPSGHLHYRLFEPSFKVRTTFYVHTGFVLLNMKVQAEHLHMSAF
jgi:hypothetical protein